MTKYIVLYKTINLYDVTFKINKPSNLMTTKTVKLVYLFDSEQNKEQLKCALFLLRLNNKNCVIFVVERHIIFNLSGVTG